MALSKMIRISQIIITIAVGTLLFMNVSDESKEEAIRLTFHTTPGLIICLILTGILTVFVGIAFFRNLNEYLSSQKTSKSSTAQLNTNKIKTPNLHIKSTAQDDKVIMTGCPAEMEELYGDK